MSRGHLTIVGVGPVGSLLALMLATRGHGVVVYERRPDMRLVDSGRGRSINLGISTRALQALRPFGLDAEVVRRAVPMRGRMVHPIAGEATFLRYGRDDSEAIWSMSRAGLNRMLISAAESTGRVQIRFLQRLVGYSFDTGRATFRDETSGALAEVDAPVVLGADGSASTLRVALAEHSGGRVQEDVLDTAYKELTMPSEADVGRRGPSGRFPLAPNALHIWPRGSFMLIALPNADGSFTCTLFLALEAAPGSPSFGGLRNAGGISDFFARNFPDVIPLIPNLGAALSAAPLGRMVTINASPWSHGSALILGDAAHAIVPFLGQGMNAGFEDCVVLGRVLDREPSGFAPRWERVFAAFARERKPDTDAVADMALEHYVELRDKVADPRFVLEKAVEAELERRYPREYRSRHQLVTFTRVPYRVADQAGRIQDGILREVCAGVNSVEQVDYERVRALVAQRVRPLLQPHDV